MKKVLRHGYTTGACAAAAAKGAAIMLRDRKFADRVDIQLPSGQTVEFQLHGQQFSEERASCFVIKDAGDDPDITNGAEIHAEIAFRTAEQGAASLIICGGTGIGRVTKPGLAVPPGEFAINPVPRRMITEAVSEVFNNNCQRTRTTDTIKITISIPDGEQRATKTLNARLGIIGGLSILGTTGIVRPVSAKAWTDTIDAALDVARACCCQTVIFSTGRTSELAAQRLFNVQGSVLKTDNQEPRTTNQEPVAPLPEEAYLMMGDHVAHALRSALRHGFTVPVVACQFAKLVKIACGYENTHAAASEMDLQRLRQWAETAGLAPELLHTISAANTAREIAVASDFDQQLLRVAAEKALEAADAHAPGIRPVFIVADYENRIVFSSNATVPTE